MATQRPPLKVAYEMPPERKKTVRKASKERITHRPEWDRASGRDHLRFQRKRVQPGQSRTIMFDLIDSSTGETWPTPVHILHGARPGPKVIVTGAIHGDELTGTLAATQLTQPSMIAEGKPLDPERMAGTVFIVPVLNPPGYQRKSRYFPDGRDLNREFPGHSKGATTRRVANRIFKTLISGSDVLIDIHSAAAGRHNMPQVRANLADPSILNVAKLFGTEVLMDSLSPKGSLRRTASESGVAAIVFEGGGANKLDRIAVKVAVNGVLNVLRGMNIISGRPKRPRFRLLASGSRWIRAQAGGLLDLHISSGALVDENETIGMIADPNKPDQLHPITSPCRGIMVGTRTDPFVHAGSPIAHIIELERHFEFVFKSVGSNNLTTPDVDDERLWVEETEVDEITIPGEWEGGSIDAEWQSETEE